MDPITIGIISIVVMFIFLMAGIHVAVVLGFIGFFGCTAIIGLKAAMSVVATTPFATTGAYTFAVIPLFILMGYFALYGGISGEAYKVAHKWLSNLPGGLALATTFGCGVFAAASGSSVATAAIFTKISLPEMLEKGYSKSLASGAIAASGTLSALIPPSALIVIMGIFTDQSIGKLLIAGFIPGALSVAIYIAGTIIRCKLNPSIAPPFIQLVTWKEKFIALRGFGGVILVFGIIIGGIYFGIFTPTEAGAIGALGAFIIALFKRGLGKENTKEAFIETGTTTAVVFIIIVCAKIFGKLIVLTKIASGLITWVSGLPLPPIVIVIGFLFVYIIMGMFFDAIAMLAITLPIIFPAVQALGISGIWFSILVVKTVEMAVISPPFGMNAYVVKGTAGDVLTLADVFKGSIPFLILDVITLALLIAFPQIVLFLPDMMLR